MGERMPPCFDTARCIEYITDTPIPINPKNLFCIQSQSQSQNYFIEPYTIKMQISFFFNKVQHLAIIWEMNTFMQSHSHTLIMKLGWGIREY